jgi:hypothetical protein
MKCYKQPSFLRDKPTLITELWEVRLPVRLWQEIRRVARLRHCTYSTITRFCAFRLAERASLRWRKKLLQLRAQDSREYKEGQLHRHMVCLYGEDAKMLRLAAIEMGVTVSALIRLTLRLYLRRLAMEKHSKRHVSDAFLFWYAIKRWAKITLFACNDYALPAERQYVYQSFPAEWRWSYPQD